MTESHNLLPSEQTYADYIRQQASAAHSAEEAIRMISPATGADLALCTSEYLRTHPEDLTNSRRYTEVHLIENLPNVLISPFPVQTPVYASVGGYHSLADEVKGGAEPYGWFSQTLDQAGLASASSNTVVAKGYAVRKPDGAMQLELQVIHNSSDQPAGDWLTALLERASDVGIDGGIAERPYNARNGESRPIMIQERYDAILLPRPSTDIPEGFQSPDMLQGMTTAIRMAPETTTYLYGNKVDQLRSFEMDVLTARSITHTPLVEAAGFGDNPKGLCEFKIGDRTIRAGIRFTFDSRSEATETSINIFYDTDYGDIVHGWEQAAISTVCDEARSPLDEAPLTVTVAIGDNPPRITRYEHLLDSPL